MKIRLKARRKATSSLRCSIKVYPKPFQVLEIVTRYQDIESCAALPYPGSNLMDEEIFTSFVLPSVRKTFLKLKEVIEA